jgi:phage host-nuclease inhibitor protein Gam
MKTIRNKSTPARVTTREDMETLIGEIAALKTSQRLLTVLMDEQIQAVRGQYEPQLLSQAEAIEQKTGEARAWAGANPHQFGSLRSIETLHGVAGWRTGGPSLRTLTGWTWDRVKETLKTLGASGYIRIKEEVNKQNLISDRESIGPEKLREIGLRVVQEEIFYVEPNFTALPASAARA